MKPTINWYDFILRIDYYEWGSATLLNSTTEAEQYAVYMRRCPTETLWQVNGCLVLSLSYYSPLIRGNLYTLGEKVFSMADMGEYQKTFDADSCSFITKESTNA